MKKSFFLLFILFLPVNCIFSQKPPIKFGDVDIADLEMKSYSKDTSAPAAILCNYGYFSTATLSFTQIVRIKIFKKEGYDWANRSFPTKSRYDIKGMTINLEKGKIIKDKLKNESIYNNKITENSYEVRIAMPNVKIGSVIDMEFKYMGIPAEWRFQETIPVIYSELIIENTPNIKFVSNFFGYEPLSISTPTRSVASDMPAFKEEPYINSKENYLTKKEFDILDITIGSFYKTVTNTWPSVNTILIEDPNFCYLYPASLQLNETAKKIISENHTDEGKLKDAFEAAKVVKWNKSEQLFTSNSALNFILRMKEGNSADINSLLLQLLKKLNIEAYPVAISTRQNGIISQFHPSLNKLNYLIVQARVGGKSYLLDATEEYIPYYLLPLRCLNSKGRIISYEKSDWVDLTTDKKDSEIVNYDLTIQDDLTLKGTLKTVRNDYSAYNFRKKYKKFNSREEYLDDFRSTKPGLIINNSEIENIDSIYLPVKEKYNVVLNNQVTPAGDELRIIPLLYHQMKENPFKPEVRICPIDFGYGIDKTIIVIFNIPENYFVSETPSPITTKLNDNSAVFQYEVMQSGKTVSIISRFIIYKPVYLINEYSGLRDLYNRMITKQSEPIILKKK